MPKVRSAVADESANELYNCNNWCSSCRHSLCIQLKLSLIKGFSSLLPFLLVWQLFLINSDDFAKVHLILKDFRLLQLKLLLVNLDLCYVLPSV